jgi:glycosyltransferase involved in cell wall biosynthesis
MDALSSTDRPERTGALRIALVSPWPPEASGIAHYATQFAHALEGRGARVITPLRDLHGIRTMPEIEAAAGRIPVADVDLVHFELGGGRIRQFLVAEALFRRCPGIVATATAHDPERMVWRAWGLAGFERLPRAVQQGLTVATDAYSVARERRLAGLFRRLFVLTATGASALERRMKLAGDRLRVIPHGGRAIPFQAPPPNGPVRLIFFGFLHPGKGIEDLIDGFAELRRSRPRLSDQLRLTIAGGAHPTMLLASRRDYLATLRGLIRKNGLADRIALDTDIPDAEIPALIQRHHAMVLPYQTSRKLSLLGQNIASSGALSWAIACGRGALVSDSRALAEDVAAGNGAVYPQGDVASLTEWLTRLAADPSITARWADNASRMAAQRTWPATADRFLAAFREVTLDAAVLATKLSHS